MRYCDENQEDEYNNNEDSDTDYDYPKIHQI